MRNFMCMFLIFVLLENVLGDKYLHCYQTDIAPCAEENRNLPDGDEHKKAMFKCIKDLKEVEESCSDGETKCLKFIITYKDGSFLVLNDCETSNKDLNCEQWSAHASGMAEKEIVGKPNCTYCYKDLCNSKLEKIETTTALHAKTTASHSPAKENKNKSTIALSNIAMLLFVPLVSLIF